MSDQRITSQENIIIGELKNWLMTKYGFSPNEDSVRHLAKKIKKNIDLHRQMSAFNTVGRVNGLVKSAYYRWYKTTGMPNNELHRHSAAGFADWFDSSYHVLAVPKITVIKFLRTAAKKLRIKIKI